MAIRTYKVTLDAKNAIAPEPVFLRQGDKTGAVVIDATLMDNGVPVSLDGLTPMFKANTADGQAVIADSTGFNIVNAPGGEFTYQVPSQLGSVPGKIKIAYFSFSDSSGYQSTFNIVFVVEKAADMTQENAKDWVSNLNEIIDQYNQWVNNAHSSWQDFVNANKEIIESIDPGGTLLAEVIDARKPTNKQSYATLGERLNDMPFSSDFYMEETYEDIDGGIPAYNEGPLLDIKSGIDTSLFNFGFGTDYHYDSETTFVSFPESNTTPENAMRYYASGLRKSLNLLSLSNKLDAVIFNGDNVDQPNISDVNVERKTMLKQHNDFATTAFSGALCPVFLLKGNHDCNYNLSDRSLTNVLLDSDFAIVYQQNGHYGENRVNNSNYYYKDFNDKKVRLIGLDSSDLPETTDSSGKTVFNRFTQSGFQQEQLNWLANNALQVPNGYTVVITMHWPLNHTVYDYDDSGMINHGALKTILEDFVSGGSRSIKSDGTIPVDISYSFSNSGVIAGVLSGHRHLDQQKSVNGINYILTRCSLISGDNMIKAKRLDYDGTPSEDAFDIVSIDTSNRILTTTRFGAGSEDASYAKRIINY